jgi:hypothetical protein
MTQVTAGKTDDVGFVELLNSLVRGVVSSYTPDELWIVQVDNWFDHKWLRFSGVGTVDFQFPAFMNRDDSALQEFTQERVTFPPFAPSRVLAQYSYVRKGDHYSEAPLTRLPHPSERRASETNLQRRVEDFSRSGAFVWYSSNTLANDRGSVMVYYVSEKRVECWFAAFNRHGAWKLYSTKGASKEEVQGLLNIT